MLRAKDVGAHAARIIERDRRHRCGGRRRRARDTARSVLDSRIVDEHRRAPCADGLATLR